MNLQSAIIGDLYQRPAGPAKHGFGRLLRWLAAVILLLAILAPSMATAAPPPTDPAPTGAFTVKSGDYFVNYLMGGLLGNVVNPNAQDASGTISGVGTMGEVFRAFNLGVAFFGSLLILFIAVVGVLNTGNDGEFLGKRWSSMWVPIRFAGGAALLLPITSSGYSFVQAMCIWIAGQGVGFADTVWDAIVDNATLKTGSEIVAPLAATDVISNVLASEVCMAYMQRKNPQAAVRFDWLQDNDLKKPTNGIRGAWWRSEGASATAENIAGREACGSMQFLFARDSQDPYDNIRVAIANEHMVQTNAVRSALTPVAQTLVNAALDGDNATLQGTVNALPAQISTLYDTYRGKVAERIDKELQQTPLNNMANLKDTMKGLGFATAGAFYMELAKTQNAVRAGITAKPAYAPPNVQLVGLEAGVLEDYEMIRRAIEGTVGKAATTIAEQNSMGATYTSPSQYQATNTQVKPIEMNAKMFSGLDVHGPMGWTHTIAMSVLQTVIQVGSSNQAGGGGPLSNALGSREPQNFNNFTLASRSTNHSVILQLKNKGDVLLDIAGVVYMAHALASSTTEAANASVPGQIVNGATGLGRFLGKLLDVLEKMVLAVVLSLMGLGIMLAVIIPMTPFMIWVMGIAGLLVLLVESLVASVLWAVMIMHPSGEGITSQHSEKGLMILMMLFFRPVLMLMGMVAGIFLVDPMVDFVNDMFYFVFRSTQTDTMTGLFIIFGICSVYITLVLAIIRKSFSLIHLLPDRVFRWIGGMYEQLGESEVADRGETMAGNAGSRVSGLIGPSMQSGSRGGGGGSGGGGGEPKANWRSLSERIAAMRNRGKG